MSEISSFSDYASQYNTNVDYSYLFSGMSTDSSSSSSGNTISLSDYASIKNGSYRKLLKAYYAKQDADKASSSAGSDTSKSLTLMKSGADALKKSAEALSDSSLWEKKKVTKTDEETGEEVETEDYDWDAITKAVNSFVEDYNDLVDKIGDSDVNSILRQGVWLTGMTEKTSSLLEKVGITIGKGNKLEVDEDKLKEANISDLKTLFTGSYSFAKKVADRAQKVSNAAATASTSAIYTKTGSYSTTNTATESTVDEEA